MDDDVTITDERKKTTECRTIKKETTRIVLEEITCLVDLKSAMKIVLEFYRRSIG